MRSIATLGRSGWTGARIPRLLARHTAAGFSTGTWQGETLLVTTTHLTEGVLSHNGVPRAIRPPSASTSSARGDHLMITMIVYDPIYLEEPYLRSRTWVYDPSIRVPPNRASPPWSWSGRLGEVPHYLPGTNPYPRRTDGEVQHSARCTPWRRGRTVSGVPQATSGTVRASHACPGVA